MRSKLFLLAFFISAALLSPAASWAANGSAYFNYEVNWAATPPLYFTVAGGPANTCGALWAKRNAGPWQQEAAGWLCTDSSGNAVKGPWYYANQAANETAYVYIKWPDGTATNTAKHVWDLTNATVTRTSPSNSLTSFYGTAVDGAWGAGYAASWANCLIDFYDATNGKNWTPGNPTYSSGPLLPMVPCTLSGMPSLSVTWNATQLPPVSAHQPGRCYSWTVWILDGGHWDNYQRSFCL